MNDIEDVVFDNIPIFEEENDESNIDEELDFLLEDEFNDEIDTDSFTLNEAEEDEISEEDAEDLVESEEKKTKKKSTTTENTQEEVPEETEEEQPTEADAEDLASEADGGEDGNVEGEETPENNTEEQLPQDSTEIDNAEGGEDGNVEGEQEENPEDSEPSEEDLVNAEEQAKENKERYSYYQLFEEMYDNVKLLVDKTKDIIERANSNTDNKGILRTILDEIYVVKEDIEYLLIEKINSMEVKNINILYITFSSKVMLLLDLIQKITSHKESKK